MDRIRRIVTGAERRLSDARRRWPSVDHTWRAADRYADLLAFRLAAAIAYYGFFAVFALGLLAYWVFGAILEGSPDLSRTVAGFLRQNLPFLNPVQIAESSGQVGVIGLVLLVFTGVAWIEAIRSSQRLIYGMEQQPGNLVVRRLVDLAVLIVVFVLLGVSVGASVAGWLLAVPINMVVAAALLAAVPRVRMDLRRLWPPVILVAIGMTLLNSVGRYYVIRTERNPAYTVVAGAVGLLLYLYLLNQLLLFGAALAATGGPGRIRDLAGGRVPPGGA